MRNLRASIGVGICIIGLIAMVLGRMHAQESSHAHIMARSLTNLRAGRSGLDRSR
jgi:hypothetical protein